MKISKILLSLIFIVSCQRNNEKTETECRPPNQDPIATATTERVASPNETSIIRTIDDNSDFNCCKVASQERLVGYPKEPPPIELRELENGESSNIGAFALGLNLCFQENTGLLFGKKKIISNHFSLEKNKYHNVQILKVQNSYVLMFENQESKNKALETMKHMLYGGKCSSYESGERHIPISAIIVN